MLDNGSFAVRHRMPGDTKFGLHYPVTDRWFAHNASPVLTPDGVSTSVPIWQPILWEDLRSVERIMTDVKADGKAHTTVGFWHGAADAPNDFIVGQNTTGWTWHRGFVPVPSTARNAVVAVVPNGTALIKRVRAFDLLPPVPRSYSEEKARCAYFYQRYGARTLTNVTRGFGLVTSSSVVTINFPFVHPLRGHDGPGVGQIKHRWAADFDCYVYGLRIKPGTTDVLQPHARIFSGANLTMTCHHESFVQFQMPNHGGLAPNTVVTWRPFKTPIPSVDSAYWIAFDSELRFNAN